MAKIIALQPGRKPILVARPKMPVVWRTARSIVSTSTVTASSGPSGTLVPLGHNEAVAIVSVMGPGTLHRLHCCGIRDKVALAAALAVAQQPAYRRYSLRRPPRARG